MCIRDRYWGQFQVLLKQIADSVAEHFRKVFIASQNFSLLPSAPSSMTSDYRLPTVSVGEVEAWKVEKVLKNLKQKQRLGPADILAYIYKACRAFLVLSLTHICNGVVRTSEHRRS